MTAGPWAGFPRAETTVECGGERHRLRWEGGALHALDHADPEGERALAALGGDPCACVEILDGWARHAADERVLLFGSRGPGDVIPTPEPDPGAPVGPHQLPTARAGIARRRMTQFVYRGGAPPAPNHDEERELADADRLALLLSLGGGLSRRLAATAAAHHRHESGSARLEAALYGRMLASLRAWTGRPELRVELEPLPEDDAPSLAAAPGDGGTLRARLPFGWVVDVWGRELEVVWGRFCLSANSEDGVNWELLSVGPDLGEPAVIKVALPG